MIEPAELSPETIAQFKQNRLYLVQEDLRRAGFTQEQRQIVADALLRRGINKWLANRTDFIKLKDKIKKRIRSLQAIIIDAKKNKKAKNRWKANGAIRELTTVREEIRTICHSSRWRFPE